MRISVAIRGNVGPAFIRQETIFVQKLSEIDLQRIAKDTEEIIKNTIMSRTQMPTGKLASFFYAEKLSVGGFLGFGSTVAWGIGNIEELDKEVPYWNHIDKGSEGIGANWQHFLPKGLWVNGRWVESDNGFFGIQPQTPIQAVNYIASTLSIMIPRIEAILSKPVTRII